PLGRTAMSRWALDTSIPIQTSRLIGLCSSREGWPPPTRPCVMRALGPGQLFGFGRGRRGRPGLSHGLRGSEGQRSVQAWAAARFGGPALPGLTYKGRGEGASRPLPTSANRNRVQRDGAWPTRRVRPPVTSLALAPARQLASGCAVTGWRSDWN